MAEGSFRNGLELAIVELESWLESAPDEVAAADRRLQQILDTDGIRFNNRPLPVTLKPHLMSAHHERERAATSEATLASIVALGQVICNDDAVLELIGFDERARATLRLEPLEEMMPVFARGDALWSETGGLFVEMNTDSPGMAVFSDILQRAVVQVLREFGMRFAEQCRATTRIDRIFDGLMRRYRARGGDKSDPLIAIVDWPGVKTYDEQLRLARELEERGVRAALFAPTDLSYRNGRLYGGDREIDLVHRRVLFPEFLARPDVMAPLIRAVRDGAVVMVNPLKSYALGNKGMLALAHDPKFSHRLSRADREQLTRTIPYSALIDDEVRKMLAASDQTDWVIKSSFGSGGSDVVLGTAVSREQWKAAIDRTQQGVWILQRAIKIPVFDLPVVNSDEQCTLQPFWMNWNPWLLEGLYAGATVRCSMAQVISISARGALAACLSVA